MTEEQPLADPAKQKELEKRIDDIAREAWPIMVKYAISDPKIKDMSEVNYVVTAACAYLFACHSALSVRNGVETEEFGRKQSLDNFNEGYKIFFEALLTKFKETPE